MRPAVLTGLALTLVTAVISGPAHSASTCPMVTDPAGDASYTGVAPGAGPGRSFDIRSVDIGSRGGLLIASVHVDQLRLSDPHATAGLRLNVFFRSGRHQFMMRAQNNTGGQEFSVWASPLQQGSSSSSSRLQLIGDAQGHFDEQRNEIRIVAPMAKFARYERLRAGSVVTDPLAQTLYGLVFRVDTGQFNLGLYGDGGFTTDHAEGDAKHRIGGRSCIVG